jgi:multiple sugar transport system permease protein
MTTTKHTQSSTIDISRIVAWIVFAILIIVTLFPVWWVVRTGLSTQKEIYVQTSSLLPVGFTLDNFKRVLGMFSAEEAIAMGGTANKLDFWLYLRNSIIVSSITVVGQTFFSAMAAYAFARLRFFGRDQVFFLYITALMIPGVVTLIPNFLMVRDLGWLDSFQGIIAPGLLMTPFAVFFLRQFFLGINHELEEAATLDGANIPRIFWNVALPLSIPALSTLAILQFIGTWNEYLWPFLVGKGEDVRVLTVALAIFRSQTPQGAPDWGGLMAGTVLSLIPTLLIFMIFGRRAVNAIQFTGFR